MRSKLVSRRKELGFTQAEVAEKAGMTRSNYAHIERGRHDPSIDQMKSIAKVLKVNPTLNFFEKNCDKLYRKEIEHDQQSATKDTA